MSKACGVVRTTLIAQLRVLEKQDIIRLGEPEKQGRRLRIMCIENTTYRENDTHLSSSSSLNSKNNNYGDDRNYSSNNTYSDNDTYVINETYTGNDICIDNGTLKNDTYIDNNIYIENNIVSEKILKSRITMQVAARELYFAAKASQVNINRLSNQCFQQFISVKQSKGSKYAIALFRNLLSKSRDNPNAYVIKAIQQGATATLEDEHYADGIAAAGETIFKKIGVEILQRELDEALSVLFLHGLSQEQVREDMDMFTKRIIE
jgi:hypothetical protein